MLFIKIKHFSKKSVSQYTYGLSSQPRTPTNQFKFLLCRKKWRKVSTHGARRYVSPEQYGIETHWVSVNFCEKKFLSKALERKEIISQMMDALRFGDPSVQVSASEMRSILWWHFQCVSNPKESMLKTLVPPHHPHARASAFVWWPKHSQ